MSGAMRFGILGPLEAVGADGPRAPSAPRVRTLLALLLVRAGAVVPVPELVEELWGASPPPSAANALQVFVGRLRRQLAPQLGPRHPDQVLLTAPAGYALRADPEQVDACRFERLARTGGRQLAEGDVARAAETLRCALALWRGPALTDVPTGQVLGAHAVTLTEGRLVAMEQRIEADLRLGRHRELVGELRALTARHPLRETFWRQLMLALHRADRQAEALHAFQRLRHSLADELGLDPGQQSCQLHKAILARDPALDLPTAAPGTRPPAPDPEPAATGRTGSAATWSEPAPGKNRTAPDQNGTGPGQDRTAPGRDGTAPASVAVATGPGATAEGTHLSRLPPDIADFTGRAEVLAALRGALRVDAPPRPSTDDTGRAAPIVVLSGRPGAGKTTLALNAAHSFRSAFPDGQLYADLRGASGTPAGPDLLLARFLRALGFDGAGIPETVEERAELFRARLAGRRILVVLDDAATELQVRPLLPAESGCAVLVTSRCRLPGLEGAVAVDLPLFAQAEAIDLLRRLAGNARVAADPAATESLARLCGRLPLAVRVAGAKLATKPHWTIADLANRLADERRRLNELRAGDLDVRASIGLSYRACNPADQRIFRLLGLLTTADFPAWVAAMLGDTDLATAESSVERLVDAQLLQAVGRDQAGQQRYLFHDLIRVYAIERLHEQEPAAHREAALDRLIGGYLDLARHADAGLQPGRRSTARGVPGGTWPLDAGLVERVAADPLAWYAAERASLLAAVTQAHAAGRWGWTWALVDNLAGFYDLRTYWDDWERAAALATGAAGEAGDPIGEAVALRVRGQLRWDRGQLEDAVECLRRCIGMLDAAGADQDRAHALAELAAVYLDAGSGDAAAACLTECVPVFEAYGDRRGLAFALRNDGVHQRDRGETGRAVTCLERSLAYYRQLGDRRWEAYVLLSRGGALWRARRLDEAADSITECLSILASLQNRRWQAFAMRQLGDVRRDQERPAEARSCYAYALRILDELGDRVVLADTLRVLGELCCEQGALAEAKQRLRESLSTFTELDYRRGKPFAQLGLARVAVAEGRHDEGAALAEQALAAFRAMHLSLWQARALVELGRAAGGAGDGDRARTCWREALAVFQGLDEPEGERVAALLSVPVEAPRPPCGEPPPTGQSRARTSSRN